ncbi:hypothetical protein D918_04120 [Trichuris suis]|nr:hypothetical protein D918_04120 [Trichuris suis]
MNCLKTEKQKYLHCVIIETQETNEPLGYICERGARYMSNTLRAFAATSSITPQGRMHGYRTCPPPSPSFMTCLLFWNTAEVTLCLQTTKWSTTSCRSGKQRSTFHHSAAMGTFKLVTHQFSQSHFYLQIPYPSYFYQDPVGRNLTRYLHKMWLEAYEDSGHFEYFMSMEQDLIYAGPIHHRYNTDNAWLAIRFSVIDDSKYQFMSEFPSFSEFHWVNITKHQLTYMTKYYVDVKQQRFL